MIANFKAKYKGCPTARMGPRDRERNNKSFVVRSTPRLADRKSALCFSRCCGQR